MGLDMYLYARRNVSDERTRQAIVEITAGEKQWDDDDGHYLSRWSHSPEGQRVMADRIVALAGLTPLIGEESNSASCTYDGSRVDLTAAYWRKANAIHAWFVDNCQGGVDECQEAEVHPEQLAMLSRTCQDALSAYVDGDLVKAREILTPREGFFFGGCDIDEYWAEDVTYTVREIERVIRAAIAVGGVTFIYQSSW